MITLPPVTRDEYNHLMRLLGEPGDIGPRSLGVGLNGAGVFELRARFSLVKQELDYPSSIAAETV